MNYTKLPPLLLTLLLHLAPFCRMVPLTTLPQDSGLACVLRWAAVVAGSLGALHTVSGASAAIVGLTKYVGNTPVGSPTNNAVGTVGQEFRFRITVSNAGSDHSKDYFNCIPLPPGLTISTNLGGNGFITNKPNTSLVPGVYPVTLYAGNTSYPVPVTYNATVTILAVGGAPPTITGNPTNRTVFLGSTATFTASATGDPPLAFQWLKDDVPVTGATASTLTLTNVQSGAAGRYAARVSNPSGTNTTTAAVLTVAAPPTLKVRSGGTGGMTLEFDAAANIAYTVERSLILDPGSWTVYYQLPAQPTPATRTLPDITTSQGFEAFRLKATIP